MRRAGSRQGISRAARAILFGVAAGLLGAWSCEGNVGNNVTGPVTFRLSVGPNNEEAVGVSHSASITADGLLVAFSSTATNISNNPSAFEEIFIKNRTTGVVQNVTQLAGLFSQTSLADCLNPTISPDGTHVVFESMGSLNGSFALPQTTRSIWVATVDGSAGLYTPVLATGGWPDADCVNGSIGPDDGTSRWIVYQSGANDISGGVSPFLGVHAPGSLVVYKTDFNAPLPLTTIVSHPNGSPNTFPASGNSRDAAISADGQYIVFTSTSDLTAGGATFEQVYRCTIATNLIELVSNVPGSVNTPANGLCARPSVSADGRYVTFTTQSADLGAPGLVSGAVAVVRDMTSTALGSVTVVGPDPIFLSFSGGNFSSRIALSDDGRFFAYAQRFGAALSTVQLSFVDLLLATTEVISLTPGGVPANDASLFPALSPDARWAFWVSGASNLILGDTNAASDIFGRGPLR